MTGHARRDIEREWRAEMQAPLAQLVADGRKQIRIPIPQRPVDLVIQRRADGGETARREQPGQRPVASYLAKVVRDAPEKRGEAPAIAEGARLPALFRRRRIR